MIEKTLAKRYAAALLGVAVKEGIVEEVESALLALKEAYRSDATFRRALGQPKIPRSARRRILRKPFEGRMHAVFLDFLDLLVEKQRVNIIPEIAEIFDQLADASQGIVRVQVSSAWPLSESQRAALGAKLGNVIGKKIQLSEVVDRGLKGGIAVKIGDSILDGTAASRLKRMREYLYQMQRG